MPTDSSSPTGAQAAIVELERQVGELTEQLNTLRRAAPGRELRDYAFKTLDGEVHLSDLFAGRDRLLAIHNMGQGCRYCTLWADGINGFLPHLESTMAVVLLSKDPPEVQRKFANSRGWRFRLASHHGEDYLREESASLGGSRMAGAILYEKKDGLILCKNAAVFGPGDMFCSIWNFLALAGIDAEGWTPQYDYWQRPEVLDDGGLNLLP